MPTVDNAQTHIDLDAIAGNCAHLRSLLPADGQLCAVVKADGYGHGLIAAAVAALAGGASRLAVATLGEARRLSSLAAAQHTRILVFGPLESFDLEEAVACGYELVVWDDRLITDLDALAEGMDDDLKARVHIKLDTGMGRLGVRDPAQATRAAEAALAARRVELVGLMTHFATADVLDDSLFEQQLQRFTDWVTPLKRAHPNIVVHAANSAATLREAAAHFDMVRCGIAIYGLDPFGVDPSAHSLQPALHLSARVGDIKPCRAGDSTGYGHRFTATTDTHLGLLTIGYGDGWRRSLSGAADALIDGRRFPLVGTVSMDSVAVDLGPDPSVLELLDRRATLIGADGAQRILAEDLAQALGTINYEITCGLGGRIVRHHDGAPDLISTVNQHEQLDEERQRV